MEITGEVVSVIFRGTDGYAVIEIEGEEPTTVVGTMPHIKEGGRFRFQGQYKMHPRYGRQFMCEFYQTMRPESTEAMVAYLESDFVKGLGPVLAKRLVDKFGQDTFRVIEEEPEKLYEVPGISRKVADSVHAKFMEESQDQHRYAALIGLGLTPKQAVEAERVLGATAAEDIRENPYILAGNVRGIDFLRADLIARKMGISPESPFRVQTAILHVLRKSQTERCHMCVPRASLVATVHKELGVANSLVEECVDDLARPPQQNDRADVEERIVLRHRDPGDRVFVYLASAAETEAEIALRLMEIKHTPPRHGKQTGIVRVPSRTKVGVELSDEQRGALKAAWDNNVCVITGGPGTGKTTIIQAALEMFGRQGLDCAMAAPTGRAAKRMEQATGMPSQTIHRLLEYGIDEEGDWGFQVNEQEPLEADVVIVDEMSMVDAYLFRALLRGIEPGTRLLLIGDADQLPSVGPGNVLRDILSSGRIATVALSHRYRNAGPIAAGASEILHGRMPQFDAHEFVFLERNSAQEVHDLIRRLYARAIEQGHDVQVLAPVKNNTLGPLYGSIALNNMLRETVNPPADDKEELVFHDRLFRVGDRVMQIVNDYQREWKNPETHDEGTGVFNGDAGTICSISARTVEVSFDDGRRAFYEQEELDALDGAFAYTIHKSQGSEFETVIMPMNYARSSFLSRSLLYTGVTRAKKRLVLVGLRTSMRDMVQNDVRGERYTGLAQELRLLDGTLSVGEAHI